MGKFIEERFDNAKRIILLAKARFYRVNLYEPLERMKSIKPLKLWTKIQDKRKLTSFYSKMVKAQQKGGNGDFSKEFVERQDFQDAIEGFGIVLNSTSHPEIVSAIDDMIIPFIQECERQELHLTE